MVELEIITLLAEREDKRRRTITIANESGNLIIQEPNLIKRINYLNEFERI